jgi:hypothetical protein
MLPQSLACESPNMLRSFFRKQQDLAIGSSGSLATPGAKPVTLTLTPQPNPVMEPTSGCDGSYTSTSGLGCRLLVGIFVGSEL